MIVVLSATAIVERLQWSLVVVMGGLVAEGATDCCLVFRGSRSVGGGDLLTAVASTKVAM